MTSEQKRTAAVAPAGGYSRPLRVDPDGLRVSVTTEDGDTNVFDFSSVDAPPGLMGPLVAAFATLSGPTGTWRQMVSVRGGWYALRRFLRFVTDEHPGCSHDHGPDRGCVAELAREHRYGLRTQWASSYDPDIAA